MAKMNVDLDYFDHPKTLSLVQLLGLDAELIPLRLWAYVGKYHAEQGRIAVTAATEVERIVRWRGQRGKALEALITTGFLEPVDGGFLVHDWDDWNGHIFAFRERAVRNAKKRWDKETPDKPPPQSRAGPPAADATSNALELKGRVSKSPLPPEGSLGAFSDWPKCQNLFAKWATLRRGRFKPGELDLWVRFLQELGGELQAVACLEDAIANGLAQLRKPKAPPAAANPAAYLEQRTRQTLLTRLENEKAKKEAAPFDEVTTQLLERQKKNLQTNGNGAHKP